MAIDWLTALGAADQSLESNMARRDVSRLQQLLMQAVNEKTQQQQFGEKMELDRKQLQETMAQRREAMEYRRQQDEMMKQSRQADDDRARASQLLSADPGTIYQQPEVEFLTKAGHGGNLTPEEGGGAMFQRRQFEEAQAKLAAEVEKAKRQEQYQAEDQKLQRESAKRDQERLANENKRLADAQKKEADIAKNRQMVRQQLEKRLSDLNSFEASQVKIRQKELLESGKTWNPFDEEMNSLGALDQAEQEIRGRRPGPQVKPGPLGEGTPLQAPQGGGNEYLSPEEVKLKFPTLPPGAKVRRIK